MATASAGYHEPLESLKPDTLDLHRAVVSLMEELEAFDWYRQRADACTDEHLRAILVHNMNEEVEHACMTLEWIRRHVPKFDEALRTYLFTSGDVTQLEQQAMSQGDKQAEVVGRAKLRATVGALKGS
ncbi:MAG: ferritin-like domain-containing protein [Candidatus Binatia bacterium]|nr:ferritin-like domain-containing protein [Candidatus Binatia bacterium]